MTYEQAVEQIDSLPRFGLTPDLDHMRMLLSRIGNPQNVLQFIHVAGTNGKGSTCAMIASVLRKSHYRVGLFISPHISDFCERIQVNGGMIPHRNLIQLTESLMTIVRQLADEGIIITEFEMITAIGLWWFQQQRCEIVVLEVGLGGRLDATNVIEKPLCSVITHLALDHTSILGDTIEQIAYEKCGIIKEGGVTVCYPEQEPQAMEVIRKIAEERHNRLIVADPSEIQLLSEELSGTVLGYRGMMIHLPLLGDHQIRNACTVLAVLRYLKEDLQMHISEHSLTAGFLAVSMPARFEILRERPLCILDGGHNPDGMQSLARALKRYLPGKRLVAVTGMMKDKDVLHAIETCKDVFSEVITLPVESPRSMSAEELAECWRKIGVSVQVGEYPEQAIAMAVDMAGKDGATVICGSLYLAGELRRTAIDLLRLL